MVKSLKSIKITWIFITIVLFQTKKKRLKKGIMGIGCLGLAWDLGSIFLGVPNLWFRGLKKNFKKTENFKHKDIIEKC